MHKNESNMCDKTILLWKYNLALRQSSSICMFSCFFCCVVRVQAGRICDIEICITLGGFLFVFFHGDAFLYIEFALLLRFFFSENHVKSGACENVILYVREKSRLWYDTHDYPLLRCTPAIYLLSYILLKYRENMINLK